MTPSPIPRWHEIVRSHDAAALPALLADDVVFESPVVHTPQPGKAVTLQYLGAAMHVFNNSSFRYVNEWHGPHSAVLEFETTCDGIAVNGVDMIAWNGTMRENIPTKRAAFTRISTGRETGGRCVKTNTMQIDRAVPSAKTSSLPKASAALPMRGPQTMVHSPVTR